MSRAGPRIAVVLLWAVSPALALTICILRDFGAGTAVPALATMVMPSVGALIAWHRPGNPIGWLYCVLGVGWVTTVGSETLDPPVSPTTVELWFYWLLSWGWIPALIGTFTFPFLLFPDGRLLSARWRIVAWITSLSIATGITRAAFAEEYLSEENQVANPAYIEGIRHGINVIEYPIGALTTVAFAVMILTPVIAITLRFRRARGVERQQVKWFAFLAISWFAGTFAAGISAEVLSALTGVSKGWAGNLIWAFLPVIAIVGLPVAVAIAMLRHRLYDVDLLIRRTLVYGSLTVSLGLVFVLLVLLPALILGAGGSTPDVVIAGSTLAVAALTRPLRGRIQRVVDRRFFRRRYDATRTVELFTSRMRDVVDLPALDVALLATIQDTMQPAHVSLWLRAADPQPSARTAP